MRSPFRAGDIIDVVVLCGGEGKRLKSVVSDRPKPMADVEGRPFLDILLGYISGFGFGRFILCAGYKSDMIRQYYKDREDIVISDEKEPLGTGGAIKNAEAHIKSSTFLAVNGDSLCRMDMNGFLKFHIEKKAVASIALVKPEKDRDYGAVEIDDEGRVMGFEEKGGRASFISAGVYAFQREVLGLIPSGRNYSLEYDLFPSILGRGLYGYVTGASFMDIGTPERYGMFGDFIRSKA